MEMKDVLNGVWSGDTNSTEVKGIMTKVKTLRTDYILHFAISALICLTLARIIPTGYAAGITLVVGMSKEYIWDKLLKKGTPEWKDLMYDAVGVLYSVLVAMI